LSLNSRCQSLLTGLRLLPVSREEREVAEKVVAGEELGFEDGLVLMESGNLPFLGVLADFVRRERVGDRVMFVTNRHINYTNVCVSKCKFCAYYRDEGAPGAFTLSREEIMERVEEARGMGVTELHIVGSLNPGIPFEFYEEMLREIRDRYPGMTLQAFTAVEISFFAQQTGMSVREVLERLRDAGLTSLPGGGAEIFNPHVRERVCPNKISGERWLEVMETAHRMGIRSNATMLYGHLESPGDIVDHILRLRDLQKKTGGFQSFIPLSFHPQNTQLESFVQGPTGFDDLKVIAVSRLLLRGWIDNIKTFWIMVGEKLAQVSLFYGANDLDGTVVEEKITHAAGAKTSEYLPREKIIRLIRGAGRIPVERTTNYEIVRIY